MKGIYKGFKYTISQFFVVKEREIQIGYPTDVKHVSHIGWDGPSGSGPSWMNAFKTGPDFAAATISNSVSALSPWSSQDFGESMRQQSVTENPSELPPVKNKQKRKKTKSNSGSTSRSAAKSKAKLVEGNANPTDINEVHKKHNFGEIKTNNHVHENSSWIVLSRKYKENGGECRKLP